MACGGNDGKDGLPFRFVRGQSTSSVLNENGLTAAGLTEAFLSGILYDATPADLVEILKVRKKEKFKIWYFVIFKASISEG